MSSRRTRPQPSVRPSGTDGADHAFRMQVDQRYSSLGQSRKVLQRLTVVSAVLLFVRSGWHDLTQIANGSPISPGAAVLLILGVIRLAVYLHACTATGYGRPRNEKEGWVKAFAALHFPIMLAVAFESQTAAERLRTYWGSSCTWAGLARPAASKDPGTLGVSIAFDVVLIILQTSCMFACRSYLDFKDDSRYNKRA